MELHVFGKFFNEQRTAKGLTQEQIGKLLGVTDKAVSRWERGECYPEISNIPKIAEIFNITIDELLNCNAKPAKLLRMCTKCTNKKCKKENYSMLPYCEKSFHWVVYGIMISVLFLIFAGIYLIVRVIDGNWTDWKLPLIFGIIYFVICGAGAIIYSLIDIKTEISYQNKK